ncbi:MAG: hypothetical protein AAGI53_12180 [Planctomycetota bacterium]
MNLARNAVAFAASLSFVGTAQAGVVAAESLTENAPTAFDWFGTTWLGQTFTAEETGRIETVDFALSQALPTQTEGSLTVEVWQIESAANQDDFANPNSATATRVARTDVTYSGLEDGAPTFLTARFEGTNPKFTVAGSTYAVVFRTDPAVSLWVDTQGNYDGGQFYQWTSQFGVVTDQNFDAYFRVTVPSPGGLAILAFAGTIATSRRRSSAV